MAGHLKRCVGCVEGAEGGISLRALTKTTEGGTDGVYISKEGTVAARAPPD